MNIYKILPNRVESNGLNEFLCSKEMLNIINIPVVKCTNNLKMYLIFCGINIQCIRETINLEDLVVLDWLSVPIRINPTKIINIYGTFKESDIIENQFYIYDNDKLEIFNKTYYPQYKAHAYMTIYNVQYFETIYKNVNFIFK